jgi:hypothetical protein
MSWTSETNIKGPQGAQGIQGVQGVKGDTGATGPQGPTGNTGTTGSQGVPGTPGETWFTGAANPTTVPGAINNDWYLNSTTGDFFELVSGTWTLRGNLKGPQGIQGIQGIQGPTGPATPASSVTFTPAGNIAATTVQAAIVELDNEKVAKAGDTMTGNLGMTKVDPAIILNKAASGQGNYIYGRMNTVNRWRMSIGDGVAEVTNAGSDFSITRCNDAGTFLDDPLTISRGTGISTFTGDVVINKASPAFYLNTTPGNEAAAVGRKGGLNRWAVILAGSSAESTGNLGTNFAINRYNDAGTFIDQPLNIDRSTGLATIKADPTALLGIATKQYVDAVNTNANNRVWKAGDTMTGTLQINLPPYTPGLKLLNTTGNYSKTLRMGGVSDLEIVNSANSAVIMTLTDTGALTTTGAITSGGSITINASAGNWPQLFLNKAASGVGNVLQGNTNNVLRWQLALGDQSPEGGTADGSDFTLARFNNAGTYLDIPLRINRNNATTTFGGSVTAPAAYGFGIIGAIGGSPWQCNVLTADPSFGAMSLTALHYPSVWAGFQLYVAPNTFHFRNDGSAQKSGAGTAWVITSDARIKDVKGDYTSGLDAVAALRPVRFSYKGNHSLNPPSATPKPAPSDAERDLTATALAVEYVGLVAQEAETTLPECFLSGPGSIDGKEVDDLRSADYTALTFALVNCVKELKARVEGLEAQLAAR